MLRSKRMDKEEGLKLNQITTIIITSSSNIEDDILEFRMKID